MSSHKPADPPLQPTPDLRFAGSTFLAEFGATQVALESLAGGAKPPTGNDSAIVISESRKQDTSVIYKKEGAYYVYFHISELSSAWWGTNLTAFTLWAMALKPEDKVYFYQTGNVWFLPMAAQILTTLDTHCVAHKVFVVDHLIETPLLMLVCDEVRIEDTACINFTSCIDPDRIEPIERAFVSYLGHLYQRAVDRKMITAEEARAVLNESRILYKTARQLRAQMQPT